ncbi:MAG: ABC transporter [Acidimicrobiia bacterium]|nr:MAG: ABC transporter [Acidimicrobiia bacterium]
MAPSIEVRNVSKRFRLYQERYHSLKERMIHFGRVPYEDFWAVREVDFEVEQGATVGLLGHNGSGKSTLLKCVAGILQPTEGEIVTRGRVAALLELGAGFHPELTGRENIYLNGSILGLSKREVEKVFDEIVAFSELEKFIDLQVRHYSSGMYVRLGFAVAVNVDPDILLVDEVLAVGDEAFQRKCLERVARFQREGRTILFVTHAADLVRRICDRALVLDRGRLVTDASPGEAVRTFRESLHQGGTGLGAPDAAGEAEGGPEGDASHGARMAARATGRVRITDVTIEHPGSAAGRAWLLPHEPLTVRVRYHASEPTDDVMFGIAVHGEDGDHLFGTNTRLEGVDVPAVAGDGEVVFEIDDVPLLDGTYLVTLAIQTNDEGTVYDWREQQWRFEVMNPGRGTGRISLPVRIRFGQPAQPTDA